MIVLFWVMSKGREGWGSADVLESSRVVFESWNRWSNGAWNFDFRFQREERGGARNMLGFRLRFDCKTSAKKILNRH